MQDVTMMPFPTTEQGRCELAAELKPGDMLCVKTDMTSAATRVRRLIRFGQRAMRTPLSTGDHDYQDAHARVVHVAMISFSNAVTGEIKVTEAVSSGARAIKLFDKGLKLDAHSGASYEIFRASPGPGLTEEQAQERVEAIRELAARHMSLVAKRRAIGDINIEELLASDQPLFQLSYSKLKALRAIFYRCWGRQAQAEKVIKPLLKEYSRYIPLRELPWNTGKVRKQMCSSLAAVRMQLAEFHQVVMELEQDSKAFASKAEQAAFQQDFARIRNPDFPSQFKYHCFLHTMNKRWAAMIYPRMQYVALNTAYVSPMEWIEHLESSSLFEHVLSITPPE